MQALLRAVRVKYGKHCEGGYFLKRADRMTDSVRVHYQCHMYGSMQVLGRESQWKGGCIRRKA